MEEVVADGVDESDLQATETRPGTCNGFEVLEGSTDSGGNGFVLDESEVGVVLRLLFFGQFGVFAQKTSTGGGVRKSDRGIRGGLDSGEGGHEEFEGVANGEHGK